MSNLNPQQFTMYHGTTAELNPGDIVKPAAAIGKNRHWKSGKSDVAYSTEDKSTADYFANIAAIRGGTPRVYEVEPLGETTTRNLELSKKKYTEAIIEHQSKEGFKVKREVK
jgi:hypothetical protein